MPFAPVTVLGFLGRLRLTLSSSPSVISVLLRLCMVFSSSVFGGVDIVCDHTNRVRNKLVTLIATYTNLHSVGAFDILCVDLHDFNVSGWCFP